MKIRNAIKSDIQSLSKIDSFWNIKQFDEELDAPFSSIFIIESNSSECTNTKTKLESHNHKIEILGFISIRIIDNTCDIMNIAVNKSFRNQRIGTTLLSYILKNIHCKIFTLEVSANNTYAIKLYKKLGFNNIHIRKNYYKDSDAIIMQKHLI